MICPGCPGCGWRTYFVETVEGEEELAWELCPECGGGDAFPLKEGEAEWREPRRGWIPGRSTLGRWVRR
jgi:hypothetical protein